LTERLPKLIEAGETWRSGAAFSPEPERGTLRGVFRSGLEIRSAPLVAEALDGLKTTLKLTFCPGAMMSGVFAEESVNPAPET
jgi:hypothetical protein